MSIQGGAAMPVQVVTEGVAAGPAKRVAVVERGTVGGSAIPVYVVTQAELDAGTFQVEGGAALPVAVAGDRPQVAGPALPVFVVSGSLSEGGGDGGDESAPAAPSSLVATANGTSQIDLAWTDNSDNETGFRIYRSTDGTNFSELTTVAADATSHSDTGLSSSTQYWYYVVAFNGAGESGASNTDDATTAASQGVAGVSSAISDSTNSLPISTPAEASEGDTLVLVVSRRAFQAITVTGFTHVSGSPRNGSEGALMVLVRVATAGDAGGSGSYTITSTATAATYAVMAAISGSVATSPVDQSAAANSGFNASVVAPALTATASTSLLLAIGSWNRGPRTISSDPSGMTREHYGQTSGSFPASVYLASQLLASSGDTGARTITVDTNVWWISFALNIKPAS